VQVFQGVVIRRSGGGVRETFTVRKISFGVGVERTFPLHSPSIAKLEVLQRGRVRRAKLYYLRDLRGRKARIRERRIDEAKLAAIEQGDRAAAEAGEAEAGEAEAGEAEAPEVEPVEGELLGSDDRAEGTTETGGHEGSIPEVDDGTGEAAVPAEGPEADVGSSQAEA
jgi:hypothetical protein